VLSADNSSGCERNSSVYLLRSKSTMYRCVLLSAEKRDTHLEYAMLVSPQNLLTTSSFVHTPFASLEFFLLLPMPELQSYSYLK
jgi:hypothetical protein